MSYQGHKDWSQEQSCRIQSLRAKADHAFHVADYETVVAVLTELLEAVPNDAQALCNRGLSNANLGNHLAAISDYSQALASTPNELILYYNRGISMAEIGRHQEAIWDFTEAIELTGGKMAEIFTWRGLCFNATGDYEKAIRDYTIAIKIDPESIGVYQNRAIARMDTGLLRDALEDLDHILSSEPYNAEALFLRGRVHDEMDKSGLALADFEQAIVLNPSRTKYHFFKGRVCASLGLHQDTLKAFNSALENNDGTLPINDLYQKRALAYLSIGELDMAVKDFESCLSEGGDAGVCHYHLGCIRGQLGEHETALWHFNQGLLIKPDDIAYHFSRGLMLQRINRDEEAIDELSFVISRDSHDAQAHYYRGESYLSSNRFKDAINDFGHAIKLAPEMVDAYCSRAVAFFEINEEARAFSDITEAIRLDSTNARPYLARACMLVSSEKPAEALADLAIVEERDPGNSAINTIKDEAYRQLKQAENQP